MIIIWLVVETFISFVDQVYTLPHLFFFFFFIPPTLSRIAAVVAVVLSVFVAFSPALRKNRLHPINKLERKKFFIFLEMRGEHEFTEYNGHFSH